MPAWVKELDDLLRGLKTTPELLARGTAHIRLRPLIYVSIVLALFYGACMGCFAVFNRPDPQHVQILASAVKVPAVFFLTLLVTFPSLYVFSALLGVRLGPMDTLRLVVAPLAVNIAVLASFALIIHFFNFCTTSYPFMKLMNVVFFGVGGLIGLSFLMTMLERVAPATPPPGSNPGEQTEDDAGEDPEGSEKPGQWSVGGAPGAIQWPALRRRGLMPWPAPDHQTMAGKVFRLWIVLYAVVGAQMGWVLRPFIGSPHLQFTWFRTRDANIFIDLVRTIADLFG